MTQVAALLAPPPAQTPKQAEQMPPQFVIATIDHAAVVAVMPATARELVEVIGFDATLDVLRKFGGKRLFVPSKLVEGFSHRIVDELGLEVAEKLVEAMGGSRLEPPMLASVERLLRDNAIRADYDSGSYTMDDLVDRYHVTQRHLRKVLKASPSTMPRHRPQRHDTFTLDLFTQIGAH